MPNREILQVRLEPIAGSSFQPTGFPDLGAAVFQRPIGDTDWQDCLLVESPQSMANHLEATGWDSGSSAPVKALDGLPYVRVVAGDDDRYLTSSRTEAHRLASAFVKEAELDGTEMRMVIRGRLGLRDDTPLAPNKIAQAVMAMDPMSLIHGVFFAENAKIWPGQPKIARALTSVVEAHDVQPFVSGGVKRDEVRHSVGGDAGAAEGYGFVPFHRTEYTAREIVASFVLDLDQIEAYGLGQAGSALLATIARWEIRKLLDGGFRPRTACDLVPTANASIDLPLLEELAADIARLVGECGPLLGDGKAMEVIWSGSSKKKAKAKDADEGAVKGDDL